MTPPAEPAEPLVEELTPAPDPWEAARRLAGHPHLLFLDSATPDTPAGPGWSRPAGRRPTRPAGGSGHSGGSVTPAAGWSRPPPACGRRGGCPCRATGSTPSTRCPAGRASPAPSTAPATSPRSAG